MKPYPAYKDSDIIGVGPIPEHWETTTIGRIMFLGRGRVISNIEIGDNPGEYPVYSSQTANQGILGYLGSFDFEGDYVTWTTDGANAGRVFFRSGRFNCTNVCGIMIPKNDKSHLPFFPFILNRLTPYHVRYDINPKLMNGVMAQIQVPLPPKSEQKEIVSYLDNKYHLIDTLIEKKQKQIALLQEQRSAIINQAATKGLNPNVRMKDSGIEWLGEVPESWAIRRFKTIFKIKKRIAKSVGFDVLSITQKGIKLKDIESGAGQLSTDYSKYQLVRKGDFAMNQMDLLTGFVDISKFNGVTSPDYRVFVLKDLECYPQYLLQLLQMGYSNKLFFPFGHGAAHLGRWRLPTTAFYNFVVPIPPKREQIQIADFISSKTHKIDALIEKDSDMIDYLKEYRTALISEVVTGKIDVRDEVIQ